ncbi:MULTISPECIES: calmodulin [Pseudoalteromonas]|uniref:Calmodulin n=1 Tax=Pseudoalteromonas amylolytica TaxID=1859457 RepID=A0A1S1MJD7_9GAMM|nr:MULTISPECIES: calmodulin [Pseudoalteromonas]MCF6437233.1 EF-hand domain-containing protein [Pseudoalteromonas sp. MMG022]OHU84336.1 calmodulin [Pseudoalteromonas sp. JW3]OHU87125.1 calmodulin [Pseudoalteromonas amylolytica]
MKAINALMASMLMMSSAGAMAANFADFDTDKDGVISKSEASASESLMKVFNELDSNKDGELSEDEFNK